MMIKCTKCGFENQMGAIFCRQCGEKINMNEITPESLEKNDDGEKAKNRAGNVVRCVVWIVLLVIIGIAAAALIPWKLPIYTAPDETTPEFKKNETSAMLKMDVYAAEKPFATSRPVKISLDELNILFSKRFVKPGEKLSAASTLDHIVFSKEGDRIRMLVFIKIFNTVPVVFRTDGMFSAGESAGEPLQIQVDSAVIGHLPLLYCNTIVAKQLGKLFVANDEIKRIFERTQSVTLEGDDFVFQFGKSGEKTNETPLADAESAAPETQAKSVPPSKDEPVVQTDSKPSKARKKSGKKKSSKKSKSAD